MYKNCENMEQKHYDPLNNDIVTEKTIKCWGRDETSLLIRLYRDHEHTTARKKQLWVKLSTLLAENNFIFSPLQVENKWKSLGRVKNRRPSVNQIMVQSGKMPQIKPVKLEVCEEPSAQQNNDTSHEAAVNELFLSDNQMERLNDDIEANCMMSEDDLSSVSSRDQDFKKGSNLNSCNSNNNNHGSIKELKDIINKFIDYYDERERNTNKYELRKIKLMEEKNRILSERNRLIKERNDILKSFIKTRNTK